MVWACQDAPDDTATGIDFVKIKPLKKRCSARAGLSRFYSSKSQSFSSIDLVHCTPFGNSALALAKRPSSFDLRRGSPRCNGLGSSNPVRIRKGGDSSYLSAATEDDEAPAERCPCNDTIFTDPSDAFISPEGSPRASPTHNMYDSLSVTCTTLPYMPSCQQQLQDQLYLSQQQQQQHCQLSNDYLGQLSLLLPMQYGYFNNPSAGGLSETSLSSCCNSGSTCSSGCRTGCCSFFSGLGGDSASTSSSCNCRNNLCRNSCPASWLRHSQSSQPSSLACSTVRDTSSTSSNCQHSNIRASSSFGGTLSVSCGTAARLQSMPSAAFLNSDAVRYSNNDAEAGSNSSAALSAVQAVTGVRISSCRSRAWTLTSAGGSDGIRGQCPSQDAVPPTGLGGYLPEGAAMTVAAVPPSAPRRDASYSSVVAGPGSGEHMGNLDGGAAAGGAVGSCCRPHKLSRHSALGRLDSGLTSGPGAVPSLWESAAELMAAISLRDEDRRLAQQYACMG